LVGGLGEALLARFLPVYSPQWGGVFSFAESFVFHMIQFNQVIYDSRKNGSPSAGQN
jgi:hypothetical protein